MGYREQKAPTNRLNDLAKEIRVISNPQVSLEHCYYGQVLPMVANSFANRKYNSTSQHACLPTGRLTSEPGPPGPAGL